MGEVLLLTGDDVRRLLKVAEAIEAVEEVFKGFALGEAAMPPKTYLDFPEYRGDLRVMPASAGREFAGVKIVNSHAGNPGKGLPAVVGTYVLVSQDTGLPLAIMDATYLTAARTGAASAVASKFMSREESSSLGVAGAGVQAGFQVRAISEVRDIKEAFVWAPAADHTRTQASIEKWTGEFPGIGFRAVGEVEEAFACDIVCTTTPSRSPLIDDSSIPEGVHINAVGADGPGKQELDPATLRRARLIVDEIEQARHGGEINVPLSTGEITESDITGTLSEVVSGKIDGRTSAGEVTVFDSTGLAIEDIAAAALVYRKAVAEGAGRKIDL